MKCHGDRFPGRYTSTGGQEHDVSHDEAREPTAACQLMVCPSRSTLVTKGTAPTREGWSKRHRRACPRHGDTDDVLPRQVVESNALFFSLGQPVAGFLVKFMRLLPTNMVGQTCERVGYCGGSHAKRVLTKRRKTVTLNEEQGEVLTWRRTRRRTTRGWRLACGASLPVLATMEYGMVSLMTSSHDKLWRAIFLGQPTAEVWLHGEVDTLDSWPAKESDCCDCDCCDSHVKRVLTCTATLCDVQCEVHDVDCRWRSTLAMDTMSAGEAREGRVTVLREVAVSRDPETGD